MYIYHTCRTALLTLIGLFAIATVVMNSSAATATVANNTPLWRWASAMSTELDDLP